MASTNTRTRLIMRNGEALAKELRTRATEAKLVFKNQHVQIGDLFFTTHDESE